MSKSVLVLEEDVDTLGALASRLRSRGLNVSLADSLDGALTAIRNKRPDAILVSESIDAQGADQLTSAPEASDIPTFVLVEDAGDALPTDRLPRHNVDLIATRIYTLRADAPADEATEGDFRGDLKQVSVPDLLQLLSMNRRTGALSITTSAGAGELRIISGDIVDVVYRRVEGEKAMFRLLGENEGSFAFTSGAVSTLRRLEAPTQHLLMEGMRQVDEIKALRNQIGADQDALLVVAPPKDDDADIDQRVAEVLVVPRTIDELLDDVPAADLEILEAVSRMIKQGNIRRVDKGGERVELGDAERRTVLSALVRRFRPEGFSGPPRLLIAASPSQLATVGHAVRRIAEAVPPPETGPAAPVPHLLATIRLAEGAKLDIIALPALDAYSPLWGLALSGAIATLRLDTGSTDVLEQACSVAEVPIIDAASLRDGELDEADPSQMAELIDSALSAFAGS